jgi:hypothetical protein
MAFNEDGSQVYNDAAFLKSAFEKLLRDKKSQLGEPLESVTLHVFQTDTQQIKLKLNLTAQTTLQPPRQPPLPPPTTKIKLHVPQQQPTSSPQTSTSPTAAAPISTPPLKKESPVLAPQPLPPPRAPNQVRQSSPLKNQITSTPSKSPPNLRPAPLKPVAPALTPTNKEVGTPVSDWPKPTQGTPMLPRTAAATVLRPSPQLTPPVRTGLALTSSQDNGTRQPLQNIMLTNKRERNLTLIPLITLTTLIEQSSPVSSDLSSSQLHVSNKGLLLSITSVTPPAPSLQSFCVNVPPNTTTLVLNAYLTKDLTFHGSYTFTVSCNGRKLAPTIWPDSTRRSGTADSLPVTPKGNASVGLPTELGDAWRFTVPLGEQGSMTSIDANCTAFLKRDERGLLVRGERSRTGQAAGEDGGELERVVIIVMRGH